MTCTASAVLYLFIFGGVKVFVLLLFFFIGKCLKYGEKIDLPNLPKRNS